MTDEDQLLLNDLNANTKLLFTLYSDMENENRLCEAKITTLQNEIRKLEQEKMELNRKMEHLKIATRILSGVDENREAKQKINRLIREIDKCIALLNK